MTQFWLLTGGLFVVNVIFWVLAVRIFSTVYQNRFESLVGVIRDAMTERDMKLRKIEALLARAMVTDTRLFDGMVEGVEEIPNEHKEEDTD